MSGRYNLVYPLQSGAAARPQVEPRTDELPTSPERQPVEQRSTESILEEIERPVLVPVKDKEVMQAIGLTRQYLRDTGVATNMNKFTVELLKNNILPYNPYPGFVRRFRRLSEKFHVRRESLLKVQQRTARCPTFMTSSGIIAGVKLQDVALWGLQHILTSINPKALKMYCEPLKSCTVGAHVIAEKCGNGVSLMTALIGPCIFYGSIYDRCYKLELMVAIVVKSADFQDAAKTYGTAVLSDVEHIQQSPDHQLLSLQVPIPTPNGVQNKSWSLDELNEIVSSGENAPPREALVQAIGYAALKKQDAHAQILVRIEATENTVAQYVPAEKTYNMMTLSSQIQPNGLRGPLALYISTVPYQVLHEGVFLSQAEADLYVMTFKNHSRSKSPMSSDITGAVQKSWQEIMAGCQLESEVLKVCHKLCLMERVQNQMKPPSAKTEESIGIEICRLAQSSGVKLELLSSIAASLNLIASSQALTADGGLFLEVLSLYQRSLNEYFDESVHAMSSALYPAKMAIQNCLESMTALATDTTFQDIPSKIHFLVGYLKAISIGLTEDALEEFPMIRRTKLQIDQIMGREFGADLNTDIRVNVYKHKADSEGYSNVDDKLLDMAQCATGIRAPQHISAQVSMMQYCIDIHLDEVWKEFLRSLLVFQDNLPPNPYPHLVTLLRRASLRVQLFRTEESTVATRVLANKPKLCNEKHHLYTLPGVPAFGSFQAVSMVGLVGYRQTSTIVLRASISPPSAGSGVPVIASDGFGLQCFPALSGEMLLYGSAAPYLTTITVQEHCFIRGARGKEHDGLMSLAKILLLHVGNLQAQGMLPTKAIFMQEKVELYDVVNVTTAFRNSFASILEKRQPVYLHVMVPAEWRYIELVKVINVYYVDEMNDECKPITEFDPTASSTQVFFNVNDALEYSKRASGFVTVKTGLKLKILESWKGRRWSSFAQYLIADSLSGGAGDNLDNAGVSKVSFCWKLHHSSCGALQYVACVAQALGGVLRCARGSGENNKVQKGLVETMLLGFRNALHTVLNQPSTLVTPSLNTYCQNLLQKAAPCDLQRRVVDVSNDLFLISTLSHVASVVQAITDALATDLVECSSAVSTVVKSTG